MISLKWVISSAQFSHSVVSDSLRPHERQHARPPCPSPTSRVHPNPCPLSQWCHPTCIQHTGLCHPLHLLLSIFPSIRIFSNESALHIRWPKYWSFSFNINLSNEYSVLIFFRITGLISVQSKRLSRIFSKPQFKSISSSALMGDRISRVLIVMRTHGGRWRDQDCRILW